MGRLDVFDAVRPTSPRRRHDMLTEHEIEIRVRYQETDPMGLLHHAQYFVYFEMGRTELLRASGGNYRAMEEAGSLVVVVKAECRFLRPARYDDLLRLRTTVRRVTAAKIEHEYHLFRGDETLAVGRVVMAMVDRQGNLRLIPESLHYAPGRAADSAEHSNRDMAAASDLKRHAAD